jgi:CubicO group peptidase (beta-lactamase class C family)
MSVLTRDCFAFFVALLLAAGCSLLTRIPLDAAPVAGPDESRVSTPTDLATTLEPFRAQNEIPGLVALVLHGDRIIAQGAVGVRKQGAAERITLDDQLHLGSCTKAMTATLVAMIVDEGKLRWTTTLGELFGDTVKDMHSAWRNVTLQQVLVHRGGLARGNDPGVGLDARLVAPDKSVRESRRVLVESQLSHGPESSPGAKEIYSNVGYIIAGAALEKITGRAWEDLMRERLFKPLRMVTGGYGAPGTGGRVDQPWGHDRSGHPIDPSDPRSDLPRYAGPCGTAHMTISDWAKFISLHLGGDPVSPNRRVALLSPRAFEHLHRASPGDTYAPGWAVGTFDPAKGARDSDKGMVFGHEGNNGFWYSKVLVAPEIDLAVLVVCNRGGADFGGKAVAAVAVELMQRFASNLKTSK